MSPDDDDFVISAIFAYNNSTMAVNRIAGYKF